MRMKQKKDVYIAGAGKFGKTVLQMFETYTNGKWNVLGFLDNDAGKQGTMQSGYPVFGIEQEMDKHRGQDIYVFIAVGNWNMKMEFANQLVSCGYKHVYILKNAVYSERAVFFGEDKINPQYAVEVKITPDRGMMPIFRYLEIHVMDGCNLKCKGCSHFSNLFPTDAAVPLERFQRDIMRLKEICYIDKLRLLGGEPLLNKELVQYLKAAKGCFPYSDIRVVTNGLLIMRQSEEVLSYMREQGIMFDISWYPPTMDRQKEILEFLAGKQVPYRVPQEEILGFSRCLTMEACHNPAVSHQACGSGQCTILREGKLYKCPLAAYMPEYKKKFDVDIKEESGMDIYQSSISEIREFAMYCQRRPIDMCRYCTEQPQNYEWGSRPEPEMEDWLVDNTKMTDG